MARHLRSLLWIGAALGAACGTINSVEDAGNGNGDGGTEADAADCDAVGCAEVDIDPSNGLAAELDQAATEGVSLSLDLTGTVTTINTDTGDVIHGGAPITVPSVVHDQPGAPPAIRVFLFRDLIIANDVAVTGANAMAIVADGEVGIVARLVVAGRREVPGPGALGGSAPCHAPNKQPTNPTTTVFVPGAGGGGGGTPGGIGGNATRTGAGGGTATGGIAGVVGGTVDVVPLQGGCRGGSILSPSDTFWQTLGGAGGGAIQIVSRIQISVGEAGIVDGGGGGGDFGNTGAGGGSGGAILLEAPVVTVNGTLAANGGAGACLDAAGEDGPVADTEAQGGNCTEANGIGDGGDGGSKDLGPRNGGSISFAGVAVAGGAGGAVGRIRINTSSGDFTAGATSLISPVASEGSIGTR